MRLLSGLLVSLLASFAPCLCLADILADGSRQVITVNLQQAKRLHEQGAIFIDIRGDDEWRIGHIDKALHFDFHNNFNRLRDSREISRDTPLVFYCESRECLKAAYASAVSLFWGFDQVFYFQDGYFAWLLQDYPIRSTANR